ncbi:hypothetical protein NMY22_g13770 [Coprinellus aureogranulatus]|nr:hypothetical protein NMY22_g13770 [Coprinellus aureogranulatus]
MSEITMIAVFASVTASAKTKSQNEQGILLLLLNPSPPPPPLPPPPRPPRPPRPRPRLPEEEAKKYMLEKEELEKELEKEKEARKRDQERWKERMSEVEEGVAGIITDLEKKVEAAEAKATNAREAGSHGHKELERALEEAREELDLANDRALKAERLLENGKDLGGALRDANERIAQVMGDLRNANAHIKDLEEEVARSDQRIDELEKDLREDKDIISQLEEELHAQTAALDSEHAKVGELEAKVKTMEEEMESARAYIDDLEEGAAVTVEHLEKLEKEVQEAKATIEAMHLAEEQSQKAYEDLEKDAQRTRDIMAQSEEALEEANRKLEDDGDHIAELEAKIASLERERDKLHKQIDNSVDPLLKRDQNGAAEEEIEILERELDEAHKEIGRLNALLSQSPARKAVDKVKDARIEMLEQERDELLERNKALRMTYNEIATPNKRVNSSMISPIHRHVLSMSIKAPRTPGAPLKDLSWLNSTMNDPTVSPLIAEIHRLQYELDVANESIDDKLDKLEDAGLGVVGLTEKLEDARTKISILEDEIARLSRKDGRLSQRLARARCKKCNIKLDLGHLDMDESSYEMSGDSLPSEPPTPPSRTTEKLKGQLQAANASLEKLRREMEDLQASNRRLNSKLKETKEESKRAMEAHSAKSSIQTELDRAKRTIADLENALSEERSRMRSIAAEQERVEKDKKRVLADLRRAESDMDDVRDHLQRLKQENHELEKELRQNSTAEQKARLLETKVAENQGTISQLRQERNLINKDHKDLQKRYSELSETVSKLREKHAARTTSHDNWRHKLDMQVQEIEELKQALDDRDGQLYKAQREKEGVAQSVSALEADLRRVRKDAEAFGKDLRLLKAEKDKLESRLKEEISKADRAKKQNQTQIKLLNEQLDLQKQRAARALEVYENHVCAADEKQISDLKLRHNKECKGLMVQIRYLKAKFTRESSFRDDLRWQKSYLMSLLAQFKRSERNVCAAIAKIGFPLAPAPSKRKRSLRCAALVVIFLNRTKRGSEEWQEQRKDRAAVTAALDEVHRRRALAAP